MPEPDGLLVKFCLQTVHDLYLLLSRPGLEGMNINFAPNSVDTTILPGIIIAFESILLSSLHDIIFNPC